ncbi:MAG: hypothetical protein AB8H86_05875 [Polyangiales bacterium]
MTQKPPYEATWGADVLDDEDWSLMMSAYGDGTATRELLNGVRTTGEVSAALAQHLLSAVVHQSTLFPVAEPVARFLLPICQARAELLRALEPFWREWLEGVDVVEVEYEVAPAMRDEALEAVRACAGDEDALEGLYEDVSPGSPMSVLHNYTYQQAALVRPVVVALLPNG